MNLRNLHILTPLHQKDLSTLIREETIGFGDWIVDFCRFPHVVWEIAPDKSYTDITDKLLRIPDYWVVSEDWLYRMTKRTGLQDKLQINGYGFWWTLNSLKFEPGVSDFGNCFAWIDLLDAIHREVQVGNVIVRGQHEAIADLVQQVFKQTDIEIIPEKVVLPEKGTTRPWRSGLRFFRLLLGALFVVYASLRRPAICFFSSTNLLRTKMNGGRRKVEDVYLGEINAEIRKRGWPTAFVEHYGINASWRAILARRFFFPTELIRRISRFLMRPFGGFRRVVSKWKTNWERFERFLNPYMRYKGYDLGSLVIPLIRGQFTVLAPTIEIQVKLWRGVWKIWKPKILYINNSYGSMTLPAIIAAKSLGITTMEQQHGIIGKNHKPYLVPKGLGLRTRIPRCDYMVLWGEYARTLLVNSGAYCDSHLRVCGFPRLDLLQREMPPRWATLAPLNIPAQAQVVLYTSNKIIQDLRSTILDSLQKHPFSSIYWVIKLHPGEKTRPSWENEIRERHLAQVRVVQEEVDFYELLAACDIHVSCVSTTIIEAAVFGKLNIGLDLPSVPDPVGYRESGAYLPVAPRRLCGTIADLLNDRSKRTGLLQTQAKFASEWCRHDGTSVQCIVSFIENAVHTEQQRRRARLSAVQM